jgi:hypothetical protein
MGERQRQAYDPLAREIAVGIPRLSQAEEPSTIDAYGLDHSVTM